MKVLIVDDSPSVRRFYVTVLLAAGIEIAGEAGDPYEARDKIVADKPDVVLLDVEMPRMDGITFLRKLMRFYPVPVVVCSTLTTRGGERALEALHAGAIDVLSKPTHEYSPAQMGADLVTALRVAAASTRKPQRAVPESAPTGVVVRADGHNASVIAIGASTGGTIAIEKILTQLSADMPPIVVTQHMPAYIVPSFAARLDRVAKMAVRVAEDGAPLEPGVAIVAPGGKHLLVERRGKKLYARIKDGPLVNGHKPSVDVLFRSVARAADGSAVGVLLTGMGRDGAKGLVELHDTGAPTLCQDEATSVVFGMPRVAIELGAADSVLALSRIADGIVRASQRAVKSSPSLRAPAYASLRPRAPAPSINAPGRAEVAGAMTKRVL